MNRIEQLREENREETQTLRLISSELYQIVEGLRGEPFKMVAIEGDECILATPKIIWAAIKREAKFQLQIIKDEEIELTESKEQFIEK
jgi:hypothetical protein